MKRSNRKLGPFSTIIQLGATKRAGRGMLAYLHKVCRGLNLRKILSTNLH